MNFTIELNGLIAFIVIFALWLKFFRYVVPNKAVSAPEAIGRAIGFLILTEIVFSILASIIVAAIIKYFDAPSVIQILQIFQFIGFLVLASIGALISMKTNENTHAMNLKIYSATIFIPNLLISLLAFESGNLKILSILSVPVISIVSGYFALKKFPQNYRN